MLLYQRCKRDLSFPQLIFSPWKVLHTDLQIICQVIWEHMAPCFVRHFSTEELGPFQVMHYFFPPHAPEKRTSP